MNLFSRISATFVAGVDKTVTQIENHDAVINAALKESQRSVAQARVKLQRVKRDGAALVKREQDLCKKIDAWSQRARENHETDRALALTCLQRRNQCMKEQSELELAISQHKDLEQSISSSVANIEKRVVEMTQQRNQLRSRESAAQAQKIISKLDAPSTGGIDDTFERWNMSIAETEIDAGNSDYSDATDDLEAQFLQVENEADLEAELDAFVASGSDRDSVDGVQTASATHGTPDEQQ